MDNFLEHIETARRLPSERDKNYLLTDGFGSAVCSQDIANASESRAFLGRRMRCWTICRNEFRFASEWSWKEFRMSKVILRVSLTIFRACRWRRLAAHAGLVARSRSKSRTTLLARSQTSIIRPCIAIFTGTSRMEIASTNDSADRKRSLRELVLKCRFGLRSELRRSVIHGDANDYNVLVDPEP